MSSKQLDRQRYQRLSGDGENDHHVRFENEFSSDPLEVIVASRKLGNWRHHSRHILAGRRLYHSSHTAPGLDINRDVEEEHGSLLRFLEGQYSPSLTSIYDYSARQAAHLDNMTSENAAPWLSKSRPAWSKVRWIAVRGLSWQILKQLASVYELHPLAVEDVAHGSRQVKADYYDKQLFITVLHVVEQRLQDEREAFLRPQAKNASPQDTRPIVAHPVYIFLVPDSTVITIFPEGGEHILSSVAQRIEQNRQLLTDSEDASFLVYSLIDAIIDDALPLMVDFERDLVCVEGRVLSDTPQAEDSQVLHVLQKELKQLRRMMHPTRLLTLKLQAYETPRNPGLISDLTREYLQDCLDHIDTVLDDAESLSVRAGDLINLIFNIIAHRSNKAMQTMSVFSVVFLPVTFIAGVYGANFDNLPEIHWEYGYLYFWILCFVLMLLMVYAMRRAQFF